MRLLVLHLPFPTLSLNYSNNSGPQTFENKVIWHLDHMSHSGTPVSFHALDATGSVDIHIITGQAMVIQNFIFSPTYILLIYEDLMERKLITL